MNDANKLFKFKDVIQLIDTKRAEMVSSNPFFGTLKDKTISLERRMSFVPYMLYFSCGCPDVMTLVMRINKPKHQLNLVENKINDFINEDNFHYNFFLRDMHTLGFTTENFLNLSGVIRHVFAEESIPVRQLIYSLVHCIRKDTDPLVVLAIIEVLEAGLFDIFTIIYQNIIKVENGLNNLQYYGDAHVKLEQNHTVTGWFSNNALTENEVSDYPISDRLAPIITEVIIELMNNFDSMYICFDNIIKNDTVISPEKYKILGTPPIDRITKNWQEISGASII